MKKIFITICKIILGLLLIITIIYSLPNDIYELFYVKAMTHNILTEIRDTIIVGVNKNKNSKALNEYLKKCYGDVIYNVVEIKENHRNGSEMVYYIKMPFMDNMFYVFINNGDITQVNFHDKVFYDPKFQHLYSEWVKKQVGIKDENVEFEFSKNTNATINFDRIDKLSKDYKEVFENTKGMELIQIFQYNIRDLSRENWYEYASNYLKYYNKIKSICNFNVLCDYNGFLLYLYKYEQDKNNVKDREEYYGTFDTPNNIDTTIINGIIYEDKAEFEQLEDEKIKKYVIDKNGNIIK